MALYPSLLGQPKFPSSKAGFSLLQVSVVLIVAGMAVASVMLGGEVQDEEGNPVVYMLCEPASHYYRVMTRSDRMPVLIGERI